MVTNLWRVFNDAAHGIGKLCNAVAEATQFSLLRVSTDTGHCISQSLSSGQEDIKYESY